MINRKEQERDIINHTLKELNHLHYHTFGKSIPLDEYNNTVQHIINDMLSLIGYGTAAEPELSGEGIAFAYAMNKSKPPGPDQYRRVVFDVGAHRGGYISVCEDVSKNMTYDFAFHCFEPEPSSFKQLKARVSQMIDEYDHFVFNPFSEKVTFNEIAISANDSFSTLYSHQQGAANASLYKPDFQHLNTVFDRETKVEVRSITSYCEEHKIDVIDLFKIDAEGSEWDIILSSFPFIWDRKIRFVQFEFGINDIDQKHFFKDFWNLLSPYYDIFRVHPEGLIPIKQYKEDYEVFQVANYLCELKKDNANQEEMDADEILMTTESHVVGSVELSCHPIIVAFTDHFKMKIGANNRGSIEQLKFLSKQNIDAIYFGLADNVALQIKLCLKYGFCHHFFIDENTHNLELPESYRICKISGVGKPIYLISNNWGYIEYGKKFVLEFL